MQRKVYRTKLRPERRDEYIQAHRKVSSELMLRYKQAGMLSCTVYLLGDDLVMVIEAEDHEKTNAILARDPVDVEWQAYVRPMKAEGDWQEMEEMFFVDLTKFAV